MAVARPTAPSVLPPHPLEVQRQRTRGWRVPPDTLAVTRPGIFGNPYIILQAHDVTWTVSDGHTFRATGLPTKHHAQIEAVWLFCHLLVVGDPCVTYPAIDQIRTHLAGHPLMCWCPLGSPCHRRPLIEAANNTDTHQLIAWWTVVGK